MAQVFDPREYEIDKQYRTAWDQKCSHYCRLCFDDFESVSAETIKKAYSSRQAWWKNKYDLVLLNPNNPLFSDLGIDKNIITEAIKNLKEAKDILTDPAKKAIYDAELKKKDNPAESAFRTAVAAGLQDKKITPGKLKIWATMAKGYGISESKSSQIIDEEAQKAGAEFVPDSEEGNGQQPNFYEVLGVSRNASVEEIREAYKAKYEECKELAQIDEAAAGAKMTFLDQILSNLEDPGERAIYDERFGGEEETPVLNVTVEGGQTVFDNIQRGTTPTVTLTIKNGGNGTLEGTIESDQDWLKPEQSNFVTATKKNISVIIQTSLIPGSISSAEGRLAVKSNGSKKVIVFKVNLTTASNPVSITNFKTAYVPLAASIFGFIGSFITGPRLLGIGYFTTIPFAIWFVFLRIKEKGITDTGEKVKLVAIGFFIGWGGGWAVFKALSYGSPHFTGFLIGAYLAGSLTYLLSRQALKFSLDRGIDLSQYPPLLVRGVAGGIVVLSIMVHSGSNIAPVSPSSLNITRSVISESLDSNSNPVGIANSFYPGNRRLYYYANYTGGIPNKTLFVFKWYRNGNQIGVGNYTLLSASGNTWCYHDYDFQPGDYQVVLYTAGHEINRTSFEVVKEVVSEPPPSYNFGKKTDWDYNYGKDETPPAHNVDKETNWGYIAEPKPSDRVGKETDWGYNYRKDETPPPDKVGKKTDSAGGTKRFDKDIPLIP